MQNTLNTQKTLFSNQSVLAHSEVTPGKKNRPLGKISNSYSATEKEGSTDTAKKQKHKKQRYKTQSIIQKILADCSGNWRTVGCGKKRISAKIAVGVKFNHVHNSANFVNLQQCRSVWLCPVCSEKIARKKKEQIERILIVMQKHGIKAHMVTLTAPHSIKDDLKTLLVKLDNARKKFFGDRKSIKTWDSIFSTIGHITSTEFKYSDQNGWHPHSHIIVFTKESYTEQEIKGTLSLKNINSVGVFGIQHKLCGLWADCCEKSGLKRPSLEHGLDIKRGYDDAEKNDAKALVNYTLKAMLANELALSNCKTGRFNTDSLTPFEIALLAENEKDFENENSKFSRLFYEYAVCSKNRNQSKQSPKLVKFLKENGLLEKSDEELISESDEKENEESKLVYELEQNEWRLLCSDFESRGKFLVLIEQDIYEFGIATTKFPRADSFLNRLLGVEGENSPLLMNF